MDPTVTRVRIARLDTSRPVGQAAKSPAGLKIPCRAQNPTHAMLACDDTSECLGPAAGGSAARRAARDVQDVRAAQGDEGEPGVHLIELPLEFVKFM